MRTIRSANGPQPKPYLQSYQSAGCCVCLTREVRCLLSPSALAAAAGSAASTSTSTPEGPLGATTGGEFVGRTRVSQIKHREDEGEGLVGEQVRGSASGAPLQLHAPPVRVRLRMVASDKRMCPCLR